MLSSCMSCCIGNLRDKYHSTTIRPSVTYIFRTFGWFYSIASYFSYLYGSVKLEGAMSRILLRNKTCPPIHQLNSKNDGAVLSLKTLELFPGVCCCGWQRWAWIELKQNWTNFIKKITRGRSVRF